LFFIKILNDYPNITKNNMENSQLFLQHWEKENNPIYPQEMPWDRVKINQMLSAYEAQKPMRWIAFDFNKIETRPPKYGKYFVHRKDGKVHWETWNGSGWAYNHNVITFWMEVLPPDLEL